MSAIYMSQLSTTLPLMEGDHHQDHHHQGHFQAFTRPKDTPILFPFVINNSSPSDISPIYGSNHHLRQHQAILEPQHMIGGSSSVFATPFPTFQSICDDMIERSSYDPYDMELQATSGSVKTGKWTAPAAPKMRITRKTSDPGVGGAAKKPRRRAQAYEDHSHSSGSGMNQPLGVIRVCSDCNTTKTPLWRSGPCGPKSLCNACGIRQRKARRAMMAPGASTDGAKVGTTSDAATAHPKVKKEKRADVDRSLPFKKRCKLVVQDYTAATATATAAAADDKPTVKSAEAVSAVPTRDLVDSIGVNWGKSSAAAAACFRSSPAFTVQDEITDAAMLLMTLSCGLVRS